MSLYNSTICTIHSEADALTPPAILAWGCTTWDENTYSIVSLIYIYSLWDFIENVTTFIISQVLQTERLVVFNYSTFKILWIYKNVPIWHSINFVVCCGSLKIPFYFWTKFCNVISSHVGGIFRIGIVMIKLAVVILSCDLFSITF